MEDTGAERFIIEKTTGVGDDKLGQYTAFRVIETTDNDIKEFEVRIKYGADLILQLESGNFRKTSENIIEIEGTKLVA